MLGWDGIMKRGGLAALVICAAVMVCADGFSRPFGAPAALAAENKIAIQPDIAGKYVSRGTNPDGTRYLGRAEITVEDGMATIRWTIAGQTFEGLGPLNGTILIVDWGEAEPVVYQIGEDGVLRGTWSGGKATDVLTPAR